MSSENKYYLYFAFGLLYKIPADKFETFKIRYDEVVSDAKIMSIKRGRIFETDYYEYIVDYRTIKGLAVIEQDNREN